MLGKGRQEMTQLRFEALKLPITVAHSCIIAATSFKKPQLIGQYCTIITISPINVNYWTVSRVQSVTKQKISAAKGNAGMAIRLRGAGNSSASCLKEEKQAMTHPVFHVVTLICTSKRGSLSDTDRQQRTADAMATLSFKK
jgi:hypothetical protein